MAAYDDDDDSSYSEEELKPPASMREEFRSQDFANNDIISQDEDGEETMPKLPGGFIDVGAILRHVDELESKLPEDSTIFGHPDPPQLYMCEITLKEKGLVAIMAVTKHCVSAQLVRESPDGMSKEGPPVEVLVMKGEDRISCAAILLLESPNLSAEDKQLVPYQKNQGLSMMSGGMVPIAPSPRVAIVVGTTHSRVISVEFSVKIRSLSLTRRNFYAGKEVHTFFEPLPFGKLTASQRAHRRGIPGPNGERPRRVVPFEPSHGVCTIVPYSTIRKGRAETYVWLSFGDGAAVRLHHAAFFASVIQKHTESQPTEKSLESVLGTKVVRWEARLPPLEATNFTLVPMPKYHPSPLAPFPTWQNPKFDELTGVRIESASELGSRGIDEHFEAIVYCNGALAENFPTLAFYTSEDQFEGRKEEIDDDDTDEGGNGNIVTSVILGIFGMLTGGASSTRPVDNVDPAEVLEVPGSSEEWDPTVPFPSLNLDPYKLYAGSEIHDPPRQITHCTVDPEGDLAAIADTLGRVSLVDLSTKQIVRMWKGLRDTSCYWLEVPRKTAEKPGQKKKTLYLVIHSRQRRLVEIWRTRNGPKVKSLTVDREAQLLTMREFSRNGYISNCYLAYSNMPKSKLNKIQRINIEENESAGITTSERNQHLRPTLTMAPLDAAARLNQLMQLLSDTYVECQSIDVFKALERINSVEDLSVALDTLASSPTLEGKMGVDGSTFQTLALRHCKAKLDEALAENGRDALTNPHVQRLAFKIAYYEQVVKAYDVIHMHERRQDLGVHSSNVVAPSSWGLEAIGWTSVYEKITKTLIDDGIPQMSTSPMRFYEFASSLESPKKYLEENFDLKNSGYKVYFSDSTRTRREILARIFKPLLGDVFSFGYVSQIFDALGTKNDGEYLMKCFGEWFASLSVKEVTKKAIFAKESPVKRWLQEHIKVQLSDKSGRAEPPMEAIYQYCRRSDELVRTFWLATLCHESISQVAEQKEAETYGKISRESLSK
jgi:Rab3 GTPase-activating protein regulatory subunit N-terminus